MNLSFYRFFFRRDGMTVNAEVFQCDGDAAAIEKAKELLGASAFATMEVWQGAARLALSRKAKQRCSAGQ